MMVYHPYARMDAPKNGHFLLADKLKRVYILNQRFIDLGAKVFEGANNIKEIRLDNDEIHSVDEDTFKDLRSLENLTMCSNLMKSLPQKIFSSLTNLKILDLTANNIAALPENLFDSNRFLSVIKFEHNKFLSIAELRLAEQTHYDFTNGFCIDRVFEKTSELTQYTSENCKIDLDPFTLVSIFREQVEIYQSCGGKHQLTSMTSAYNDLEQKKLKMMRKKDALEHEITRMKIYKNAMC
jgi:Leucine-rich repeat (LRR) protein